MGKKQANEFIKVSRQKRVAIKIKLIELYSEQGLPAKSFDTENAVYFIDAWLSAKISERNDLQNNIIQLYGERFKLYCEKLLHVFVNNKINKITIDDEIIDWLQKLALLTGPGRYDHCGSFTGRSTAKSQ